MCDQWLVIMIITCILVVGTDILCCYAKKYKIHNNIVRFFGKLAYVGFNVDAYCITSGQSFSEVKAESGLKLNIRASRYASGSVASCFNQWVLPNHNTFNHSAKNLNFAVKGTLTLHSDSSKNKVYTLYDIVLAQGRTALSNNWWLGGADCQYAKKALHFGSKSPHNKFSYSSKLTGNINCKSADGQAWCFHRTGPGTVNDIHVYKGACGSYSM